MEYQSELWRVLDDEENDQVWNKIDFYFNFHPSYTADGLPPFTFQFPVDSYDISNSMIYTDDEAINEVIKSVFIESLGDDGFMYALDWQHTCFRYNPRINTVLEYPVFINDERYDGGGYNVYFPTFYPNGDYYFFVAYDFRWGYLTHPWLKKVWVFGEQLKQLFKNNSAQLGFIPCAE